MFLSFFKNDDTSSAGLVRVATLGVIFLFISLNTLSNQLFSGARLDLTENNLYTLNPGTFKVLETIKEPITLRLFFSDKLSRDIAPMREYGQRVKELIEEYVVRSNGMIRLERVDPEPFTDNEDLAILYGLQGMQISQAGEKFYFGLVATNSTDDISIIPFFEQNRETYLEYDISRIVNDLANPMKKKLGLITTLPINGGLAYPDAPASEYVSPWEIYNRLGEVFEIISIPSSANIIPKDIDLLMVVHPKDLTNQTKYAIDQFVLSGKGTIFFVDPYSEVERNALPIEQRRTYIPGSNLNTLFSSYGAYVEPGMIVGDRISGRKVTIGRSQNSRVITYVLWLGLTKDLMNPNNLITNELESVLTNTSGGIIRSKDAKSKFEILYSSNSDSMFIERFKIQFRPDPTLLLSEFQSDKKNKPLAISLTGEFKSAYIEGPPKPDDGSEIVKNPNHLNQTNNGNILIFADTDMLSNSIWTQKQDNYGKETFTPISDNGSLVMNAVEYLSGGGELIALRTRGTSIRPFIIVEELQKKAETAYRETEKSLQNDLTETENKLRDLQRGASIATQDGAPILSKEQADTLQDFKDQIINIRKKLRDVQRDLRVDIEKLGLMLKLYNIWITPILVSMSAVLVFIMRRRKRINHLASMRNK
jgi:ABC-type uncharacterized transport system involved in gliding motility auxiliary subunit